MQPQTQPWDLSVCPSFNSYTTSAQLADDVVSRAHREEQTHGSAAAGEDCEAQEEDFEFVSLSVNPDLELFIDGEIRPIFPVFNRDLLSDHRRDAAEESICVPLQKLFLDEDEDEEDPPASSSSSEADELESVTPGTYCVWTPKLASPSPSRCEKSNSTGSSATAKQPRRWRFRDLLKRSNSEGGKDSSLVFLTPASESYTKLKQKADKGTNSNETKSPARPAGKSVSAHEKFYVRNRKMKEEDKRRSYLPYRRGLVGFFANVNGLGKTFPPF